MKPLNPIARRPRIAKIAAAALLLSCNFLAAPAAHADDAVDLGAAVPDAEKIKQGLFPDDECKQLQSAGFKCMGFKPPVRFSLPAVSFKLGSAELPDQLKHQLDAFAQALRDRHAADDKVRVEGHADASGDIAANNELSLRRAENAREYLIHQGVSADLLVAVGLGAKDLKDPSNPTSAENRRVVIGRDPAPPTAASNSH